MIQFFKHLSEKANNWLRNLDGFYSDPSSTLFRGIRRRLILWYMGALVAVLFISGIVLYVGAENVLLGPVNTRLATNAQLLGRQRAAGGDLHFCRALGELSYQGTDVPYIASFNQNGALLCANGFSSGLQNFLSPELAKSALSQDNVTDTIDGGNGLGAIRRYALIVRDPNDNSVMGVIQVGFVIDGQLQALHTLLTLLLWVGVFVIVSAGISGFFLATRALEPAKLATSRQRGFIADAAHELRTPVTLLRADAETLQYSNVDLSPEDAALLDNIVMETDHMGHLITNLLALARLDAGKSHLEIDIIRFDTLLEQIAQRATSLAKNKQLTLSLEGQEEDYVIGDRQLLEQVILILLDNAIKYTPPGGSITLALSRTENKVNLAVSDTGIGIAANHLSHLGERFYRVDDARARESGGMGLGLSIAYSVITALHGTLKFKSTPNKGTTVTVQLPRAVQHNSRIPEQAIKE
jgi:signal transduction histidine kinase